VWETAVMDRLAISNRPDNALNNLRYPDFGQEIFFIGLMPLIVFVEDSNKAFE
jgi:hypothetical protein